MFRLRYLIIPVMMLGVITGIYFLFFNTPTDTLIENDSSYLEGFKQSSSVIHNSEKEWSFNIIPDPKEEVDATIFEIDETTLELTLFLHDNSTVGGGYKWDMALCNSSGSNLQYLNEDAQGGFNNSIPLNVNYGKLTDFGMNETWCSEQNNYGFILFNSGGLSQLPKKIRLLTNDIEDFELFGGTGSITIDATAAAVATQHGGAKNICRTSDGTLHSAWEGGGSDGWYGNSTNNGATWTTKEIHTGTVLDVGILCNSTDDITIYFNNGGDMDIRASPDNFASIKTGIDGGQTAGVPACATSSTGLMLCASGNNFEPYISNSSAWNTEFQYADGTDDIDDTSVEFDSSDNAYVVGIGTDQSDIDIFSNQDGWTRHTVNANSGYTANQGVSIAIDDDDNIYIAASFTADLWFCNSTASNFDGTWSCGEIDADASVNPQIVITENGDLIIVYASSVSDDGDYFRANSTDKGASWQIRYQIPSEATSGFPSILGTNYPAWNNITSLAHSVYTFNSDVLYINWSVEEPAGEPPADTCTCPGINTDWEIDHSDSCDIIVNCDLGTGTLNFTGTGTTTCNATIDTTNMGRPGVGGVLNLEDSCLINVS